MTTEGSISRRTIDTSKRKQALESHFAEDFSSLTYPMLADLYYNEGDLVRAKKVCSIGLDHHPSHAPGLFLMAKILVRSGDLPSAEKCLDSVLDTDNTHIEAAELAVAIKERLKRKSSVLEEAYRRLIAANPLSRAAHVRLNRIVTERELVRTVKQKMAAKAAGAKMPEIQIPKQFTTVPHPDSTSAINADFEIRALDIPEIDDRTAKLAAEMDWEENIRKASASIDDQKPSTDLDADEMKLSDEAAGDEPTTVAEVFAAERAVADPEAGTVEATPIIDEATERIIAEEELPGEPSEIATALAAERSVQEAAAFDGDIEDLDLIPPEPTIPLDDLLPLTFEGGIDSSQADPAEEALIAAIATDDDVLAEDIEAETITDEPLMEMEGEEPQAVEEDTSTDEALESHVRAGGKISFPGTSTAIATGSEQDDETTVADDTDESELDDLSSIEAEVDTVKADVAEDTDLDEAELAELDSAAADIESSIDDAEAETVQVDDLPEPAELDAADLAELSELEAEESPEAEPVGAEALADAELAKLDSIVAEVDSSIDDAEAEVAPVGDEALDDAELEELDSIVAEIDSSIDDAEAEAAPVGDEALDDAELAELDSIVTEIDASTDDVEAEAKQAEDLPEPAEMDDAEMADLSEIATETVSDLVDVTPEQADMDDAEMAELSELAEEDIAPEPVEEHASDEPVATPIQRANADDSDEEIAQSADPDAGATKPELLDKPEPEAEPATEAEIEQGPFGVTHREKVHDLVSEITGEKPRDEVVIKAVEKAEETERKGKLQIDPHLATFTLATIYKVQGLYQQALNVLTMIEEKGGDSTRIKEERESISSLMSKGFRQD